MVTAVATPPSGRGGPASLSPPSRVGPASLVGPPSTGTSVVEEQPVLTRLSARSETVRASRVFILPGQPVSGRRSSQGPALGKSARAAHPSGKKPGEWTLTLKCPARQVLEHTGQQEGKAPNVWERARNSAEANGVEELAR